MLEGNESNCGQSQRDGALVRFGVTSAGAGTTDVPMMSQGTGIGREGGRTGAREDRRGRGLALRDAAGVTLFRRHDWKCARGAVPAGFVSTL